MILLLAAASLVLTGVDVYLSHRRISKYGSIVEYNSIARQVAEDFGAKGAAVFLVAYNLAIIALCVKYSLNNLLSMFLGAKLTLALVQVKSLQMETFIEKLFSAKRKDNVKPNSAN